MAKKKKIKRPFKANGVMALTNDSGIEVMVNGAGTHLKARVVVAGEKKPICKSAIFFNDEGEAYFILVGDIDKATGEMTYVKFYLSEFVRVG